MRKRVGEFLVERGLLTASQVDRILDHGQKTQLRFGDAAVDLGILTRDELLHVFGPSNETSFFALDPSYFPEVTKGLFPVESMLKFGLIPLGVGTEPGFLKSRKVLNLGLLDPGRRDAVAFAEIRLSEILEKTDDPLRKTLQGVQGTKVFLVLVDQFLGILNSAFGLSEGTVRGKDAASLDPTVVMYLDGIPGSSTKTAGKR